MNRTPLRPHQLVQLLLILSLVVNFFLPWLPANHSVMAAGVEANQAATATAAGATEATTLASQDSAAFAAQQQQKARAAYGNLPISFEPNQGHTDPQVKFLARGQGYNLFFTPDKAVIHLKKANPAKNDRPCQSQSNPNPPAAKPDCQPGPTNPGQGSGAKGASQSPPAQGEAARIEGIALNLSLIGAKSNPKLEAQQPLVGRSNYLLGSVPNRWHTDIPNYGRLVYQAVYPGIDLAYYGQQRQLESDFIVTPGADPALIAFQFEGADKVELDPAGSGDLVIQLPSTALDPTTSSDGNGSGGSNEQVRQKAPILYQQIGGVRQSVTGSYVSRGQNRFGFTVGSYDRSYPLIIDPILQLRHLSGR